MVNNEGANYSPTGLKEETIGVIRSGPVSVHFVNELLNKKTNCQVHLFGEEEARPYSRIALSQLLSGLEIIAKKIFLNPPGAKVTT